MWLAVKSILMTVYFFPISQTLALQFLQRLLLMTDMTDGNILIRRVMMRGGEEAQMLGVHPALLHDGRHSLLVLPLVLLVQLGGLAVGRAVGVGLVQQRLN